jgi:methionyl-tRNA synthetase
MVDFLKAFNWLTYYEGKFSTSQGVGVFMDEALEILPPDYWRYYLMANAPEADDTHFSWEAFGVAVNRDLAGTFGSFVNSSLAFGQRHFGGEVPAGGEPGEEELELASEVDRRIGELTVRMSALEFRRAVAELRGLWSRGNGYFNRKQPWEAISEDREDAALTVRTCINLVALFARLSAPLMPFTADRVLEALDLPESAHGWPLGFDARALDAGHRFSVPPLLFPEVSAADLREWRARFGGPEKFDVPSQALTGSLGVT